MRFPLYIGFRYLKSKKKHNVINIISWIAATGIGVTTAALIIVLSVFNGFEQLVRSLYTSFDPDIQISAKFGKTFSPATVDKDRISALDDVTAVYEVVQENVLLKNDDKQIIASFKGVEDTYFDRGKLFDYIVAGDEKTIKLGFGVVGFGISYYLNLNNFDLPRPITLMVPKRTASNLLNPLNAFNTKVLPVGAVFSLQQELDDKYLFVPVSMARELLDYTDEVSYLEVALGNRQKTGAVKKDIQQIVGDNFVVKTNFELQDTLYKMMHAEKIAVFLILAFIILISAFNIIGSLSMLVINKEKDIAILHSMGATLKDIKKIFFNESLMLTLIGACSGLAVGFVICLLQQKFGIITFGQADSFVINSYPVYMMFPDFIVVLLTVILIGIVTSLIPVSKLKVKVDY